MDALLSDTATPACLLTRASLRLALASLMGLPVFPPGQRCHYTPVTTGKRCHQQLGTHSEHVFSCAQAPGMRRRNRLRDAWIHLCRAAGWHAQLQQLIFTVPEICKRADLVVLTPDGTKLACDFLVTASPTPAERRGPHLEKMAGSKARQYQTVSWGSAMKMPSLLPRSMMLSTRAWLRYSAASAILRCRLSPSSSEVHSPTRGMTA